MDGDAELFATVEQNDLDSLERRLREQPALAAARNDDGISLLLFAQYHGAEPAVAAILAAGQALDVFEGAAVGDVEQVERLVGEEPALVAAYSSDGFTALHLAAFFGRTDAAAALLRHGAAAAAVSRNAMQVAPLHSAAAGGHHALCALLLDAGADVNARQHGGWTALHAAAQHGDRALVDLLLAHGADAALARDGGETPADTARAAGHAELAERLSG